MRNVALLTVLLAIASSPAQAQKDLDLKAEDGTPLKATYYAAPKPGPGVVLLHMCNSNRKAWAGLAPMLAAKGIHVLALDYRGYGDSGGGKQDKWTPEERARAQAQWPSDIDKAYAALIAQPGVDAKRMGAGGGSCGVNNAIQLARRHPEVTALVLLAGGTDVEGEKFLESAPWIPIYAVGAHDDGTIVETLRWVVGFSSNPQNQLKEYDKGGHGTELFAVHKDLEPAIVAWFEKHLVVKPVKAGGKAKPGPSAKLATTIRSPGGIAKLRAQVKAGGKAVLPPEGALNQMGYGASQAGKHQEAIEVFLLNTEAHPTSANAFDSLGDAYLAAGDKPKAAEAAKKALALLDADKSIDDRFKAEIRKSAEGKLAAAK
jgi:pimeloyl-ACP methyl ester carboxylesterase